MSKALLSTAYCPPQTYWKTIHESESFLIETHEHYLKQTFRNRMTIMGSSGPLYLSIPVKKVANHTPIKEVRIDYATPWQRTHWRTLTTVYNNSPFFLYYQDFFQPFYERKIDFLIDYNTEMLALFLKLLKINRPIHFTSQYEKEMEGFVDYRDTIQPKSLSGDGVGDGYSCLSIFEVLFNNGHEQVLKNL